MADVTPDPLTSMLLFLAPEFKAWPQDNINAALYVAAGYRPASLPCRKADEAQCYYAAWLLTKIATGKGDGSGVAPGLQNAALLKEGDLTVEFSDVTAAQSSAADNGVYIARWRQLSRLASRGAVMTRLSVDRGVIKCPPASLS